MKKIILPKSHLSYSALQLWSVDKNKYRRRYYENIKEPDNEFSLFGREVHAAIDRDPKYAAIRLPEAEHKISVSVAGVPILGYLDTFDPATKAYKEWKSGIRKPDGSPRWTQVDVEKHRQLDFYSLLIQEKYGVKVNTTSLVWLETEFREKTIERAGVSILLSRALALMGKYEVFPRKIYEYQRKNMRKWIKESAKEIENDFRIWRQTR